MKGITVDNQAETKPQPETEVASSPAVVAAPKAIAEPKPVAVKPVRQPKKAKAKARARKPAAAVTAKVAKLNARRVNKARRPAGRKAAGPRIERTNAMTFDATKLFTQFDALPGADKFQTLFADAGERSQDLVRKSQKAAEQLAEIAKANVEALTEAGRIATSGARTIGQDALANSRTGIEQAAAAVKTLAEAKSPTEFFQLQSELLRASFDRAVTDGSKLTEQLVKLAGEAVQPLSTRASLNAERINELTA
jgi:phasin family protein